MTDLQDTIDEFRERANAAKVKQQHHRGEEFEFWKGKKQAYFEAINHLKGIQAREQEAAE